MFETGQKVMCVNGSFPPTIRDYFNALPSEGSIYTVRDLVPGQDWGKKGKPALYLRELVNLPNMKGTEPGFALDRFRELEEHEEYLAIEEEETEIIPN